MDFVLLAILVIVGTGIAYVAARLVLDPVCWLMKRRVVGGSLENQPALDSSNTVVEQESKTEIDWPTENPFDSTAIH